jgi:hypothetical protein
MIRRVGLVWVLLAVASVACGDARSKLRREERRERRRRRKGLTAEERWADTAMREVVAEHRRLVRREAEILPDYRTEASLVYLDRERAAHRDPFAAQRERGRQLADERYKLDGLRYVTASDYRIGSETRIMAGRRGGAGTGGGALYRAERWAMDGAADQLWREQQRQAHMIREILALADEMEREAQAKTAQPPKKAAWRRFIGFMLAPFRRGEE